MSLIIHYKKSWKQDFEQINEVLLEAMRSNNVIVEHVGSTSVPNLAAKPIIDIDVIYKKPADFNSILKALETTGYYHVGDQGIIGREVFKRNGSIIHPVLDSISHHLYVCLEGNEELKKHLKFRDQLRTNDDVRREYEILKLDIAKKANQDKKEYARLKEVMARDFIEGVLAQNEASTKAK
jgi:GrpB-like predicted nucleotidyltransferase (UPF0157 family)